MVVSHGFVQRGSYNQCQCIIQVAMSSKWKREKRYEYGEIKPDSAHIDSVRELDPCASFWRCRHQHDHLHNYQYRHTVIHHVGPSSGIASSSPCIASSSPDIASHCLSSPAIAGHRRGMGPRGWWMGCTPGESAENGDAADVVVVEAAAAAAVTAHMCRVIEPYQMLRLMMRRLHQ